MPDTGACAEINDGNRAASGQRHTKEIFLQSLYWDPPLPWGFPPPQWDCFLLAGSRAKAGFASVVPTLLMSLSMALGTILWPLLSKRYERKQQRRKEEKRCYVYSCYLLEVKQRIQQAMQEETAYLQHWYPPVSKLCVDFLAQKPYRLRCVNHADWLHVVLGQGSCPTGVDLQIPHVSSMTQECATG